MEEEMDDLEFMQNIDVAMDNSYKVLTGVETFESILERDGGIWLLFDPKNPNENRDNVLEVMLMYFEDNEEYERCSVIKSMIEE
tara:strand:- start:240 stop:491 length:252 start_codon:yes stop_codon:yes gene_type:complete